jgi:hypothetical protein
MAAEPLKLIGLLSRRPDLSLAQFAQHWRTTHRDLSLRLIAPGIMDGYVQNHRLSEGGEIAGLPCAGDGFPELWTSGADLLKRLASAPEYLEGAYLDEGNFMDGRSQALLLRQQVIDDGPGRVAATLLFKVMLFFRRDPGLAREAFAPAFLRPHHPLLLPDGPRPARLTRHVAVELPGDAGAAYVGVQTYDGVEASYWPDLAAFRAAWSGQSAAPAGLIDPAATVGVIVREEPVLFTQHIQDAA